MESLRTKIRERLKKESMATDESYFVGGLLEDHPDFLAIKDHEYASLSIFIFKINDCDWFVGTANCVPVFAEDEEKAIDKFVELFRPL